MKKEQADQRIEHDRYRRYPKDDDRWEIELLTDRSNKVCVEEILAASPINSGKQRKSDGCKSYADH
jgi:hypothetical protein